jgi:hypothetical protein
MKYVNEAWVLRRGMLKAGGRHEGRYNTKAGTGIHPLGSRYLRCLKKI